MTKSPEPATRQAQCRHCTCTVSTSQSAAVVGGETESQRGGAFAT